jgi:hypothetical protein
MLQGFAVFSTDVRLGSSKETEYNWETELTTFVCTHFVTTVQSGKNGATASPPTLGQMSQPQLLLCVLSLSVRFGILHFESKTLSHSFYNTIN